MVKVMVTVTCVITQTVLHTFTEFTENIAFVGKNYGTSFNIYRYICFLSLILFCFGCLIILFLIGFKKKQK